jgi:SAM-dependent methyltransferase
VTPPRGPDGAAAGPRTPAEIFDMMLAYKTTALLGTAVELGVFDSLAGGGAGAAEVAGRLGLDERATRLLLNALAAIRLLESDGRSYALAEGAAAHLVRGRPGYVGDMTKVMSSAWEWDALKRLPEAVRRGGTVLEEHAETPGYTYWEDFAAFAGAVARPTAEAAARALAPWASARERLHVLDMACGHGLYGFVLACHYPRARVWSLDWPNVLPIAVQGAERLDVADRVSTIAGDMFEVPLGGPYDLVLITNVLHHFSEERGTELLRRASQALVPQGKVVLVGFTVEQGPPAADPAPHLFSILMLVWTFAGEVHPVAAYQRMLWEAGFGDANVHRVPSLPLRVMVADKA